MRFLVAKIVALLAIAPKILHVAFRLGYPVHAAGAILISGTSSGIGRATCGWLAERYPDVHFYCGVRRGKDSVGAPFDRPNVKPVFLDVTNRSHVDHVLREIHEPLIGVINNAGISDFKTFEFLTEETLRTVLEVNLLGAFRLTQAALPKLLEAQGRVVFVTSLSAVLPGTPMMSSYIASKRGLEGMGDALRLEMAPRGVSVSLVEPGFVQSSILDKEQARMREALDPSKPNDEQRAYPELFCRNKYMENMLELMVHPGRMEETCEAMEHAMFSKYPQTRYLTSRTGPLPAWLAAKPFGFLPDRVGDFLLVNLDPMVFLQELRIFVESMLGVNLDGLLGRGF